MIRLEKDSERKRVKKEKDRRFIRNKRKGKREKKIKAESTTDCCYPNHNNLLLYLSYVPHHLNALRRQELKILQSYFGVLAAESSNNSNNHSIAYVGHENTGEKWSK